MRTLPASLLIALTLSSALARAEPVLVVPTPPADPRHRVHGYLGGQFMGLVAASQATSYEQGYLSHFGGGVGFFAGVRLSPYVSLEANWTTTLHDEAWGDRYAESVKLRFIYVMTGTVDVKLHLPGHAIAEPYFQLGAGVAVVGGSYPDDPRYQSLSSIFAKGAAVNAGAGLDLWVAPYLSLGGRVLYRGLYFGAPSFMVGESYRNLVSGVSVDAMATLHF
jgi:hypothetical protein